MIVKCQYCNLKDTEREQMMKITKEHTNGKKTNKYYHHECYNIFIEEEKVNEKEQEEKDRLNDIIKDIHEIKTPHLPEAFWIRLNELRHGSIYIGRKTKKRYKEGFSFHVIAETYLYCKDSIKFYKKTKGFKSTTQELNYCYTVICDKITYVKKKLEKKEFEKAKKQAETKKQQENMDITHETRETVKYKKQKREDDLSEFL
jgi:hypothetical protein